MRSTLAVFLEERKRWSSSFLSENYTISLFYVPLSNLIFLLQYYFHYLYFLLLIFHSLLYYLLGIIFLRLFLSIYYFSSSLSPKSLFIHPFLLPKIHTILPLILWFVYHFFWGESGPAYFFELSISIFPLSPARKARFWRFSKFFFRIL